MCNLCSSNADERAAAVKHAHFCADQLEALAKSYRHIAAGTLPPHGEEAKKVGCVARSVVRELVNEWV